jgi:pilus assembly protein CpaB
MKSKSFVLMIVSLGFGLVAAIGISQVMGSKGGNAPEIPKRPVLVAAVDLEHNSLLTEENVKIEEWPVEIVPENTAESIQQITDMHSRQALAKGMPINLASIVHKKKINEIVIPEGYAVYSIKVSSEETIYGMLQPGDKVNVIGHIRDKPAKTFLRGIRVFSINSQMKSVNTSREEGSTGGDAVVGILVTERQSELIMQVSKVGTIKLVLRGDSVQSEEENAMDEEGIAGLGLVPEDDDLTVEMPQPQMIGNPTPITFTPPKKTQTMKIWSKEGMEMVTFRDGVAVAPGPIDRHRPQPPQEETEGNSAELGQSSADPQHSSEASESKFDDTEDSEGYKEFDRGLEEDKY